MIFKIAWRNIWRSRIRSFTVMGSIIVGVWALVFILSFTQGMIATFVKNAVENEVSHIQLHHPQFMDEKEPKYTLADVDAITKTLASNSNVASYTARSLNSGMAATANGSRGVQIRGVLPKEEAVVTKIDQRIVEGEYFLNSEKKNPVVISTRLAEKMNVKLKSKIILTFQDAEGELISAAFKIIGLFKTGNSQFDDLNVFIQQEDLSKIIGNDKVFHEVALLVKDADKMEATKAEIAKAFPATLVENYKEVSPSVNLYETQIASSTYIIIFIVMLALIFGIINTMLMAVLERSRELGMLMAVGMKRLQVFTMIVVETFCLGMLAAPLGLLFGFLTLTYFGSVGIDMSSYGEAMSKVGMAEIIYTKVDFGAFITVAVSVGITALLGALYPAIKATRLKPIEAMHTI